MHRRGRWRGAAAGAGTMILWAAFGFAASPCPPVFVSMQVTTLPSSTALVTYTSLVPAPEGGLFAAGFLGNGGPRQYGWVVARYGRDGILKWLATIPIQPASRGAADRLVVLADGSLLVSGWQLDRQYGWQRALLAKYDQNGSVVWARYIATKQPPPPTDHMVLSMRDDTSSLRRLLRRPAGGWIAIGEEDFAGGPHQLLIQAVDQGGELAWSCTLALPSGRLVDSPVRVEPDGSIRVKTISQYEDKPVIETVISENGKVRSSHKVTRTATWLESDQVFAHGAEAELIPSGLPVWNSGAPSQDWTLRCPESGGSVGWEASYRSPNNGWWQPNAFTTGSDGSVWMAGIMDVRGMGRQPFLSRYGSVGGCLALSLMSSPGSASATSVSEERLLAEVANRGIAPVHGIRVRFTPVVESASVRISAESASIPISILQPGGTTQFSWAWSGRSEGSVTFQVAAEGTDTASGLVVRAASTTQYALSGDPREPRCASLLETIVTEQLRRRRLPLAFASDGARGFVGVDLRWTKTGMGGGASAGGAVREFIFVHRDTRGRITSVKPIRGVRYEDGREPRVLALNATRIVVAVPSPDGHTGVLVLGADGRQISSYVARQDIVAATFGARGSPTLAVSSDGSVLILGLTSDGTWKPGVKLDVSGMDVVRGIAWSDLGYWVAAGGSGQMGWEGGHWVIRAYDTQGETLWSWGSGDSAHRIAIAPNGSIIVGGQVREVPGVSLRAFSRIGELLWSCNHPSSGPVMLVGLGSDFRGRPVGLEVGVAPDCEDDCEWEAGSLRMFEGGRPPQSRR